MTQSSTVSYAFSCHTIDTCGEEQDVVGGRDGTDGRRVNKKGRRFLHGRCTGIAEVMGTGDDRDSGFALGGVNVSPSRTSTGVPRLPATAAADILIILVVGLQFPRNGAQSTLNTEIGTRCPWWNHPRSTFLPTRNSKQNHQQLKPCTLETDP